MVIGHLLKLQPFWTIFFPKWLRGLHRDFRFLFYLSLNSIVLLIANSYSKYENFRGKEMELGRTLWLNFIAR